MKRAGEITDRAKRYRAQRNQPAGPKRCTLCSSRRNVDIDHITGDETDGEPENLMWLCRPCNARKAIVQSRNRIGIRTRQYNPRRAPSFKEFQNAGMILTGLVPGDAGEATAVIYQTPPEKRLEYAERIEEMNPFRSEAQRRKFFATAAAPIAAAISQGEEVGPSPLESSEALYTAVKSDVSSGIDELAEVPRPRLSRLSEGL